jgi:hypothetical protein
MGCLAEMFSHAPELIKNETSEKAGKKKKKKKKKNSEWDVHSWGVYSFAVAQSSLRLRVH